MAESGLDGEEERERLSTAEPPEGNVAEERARLVWACTRLLNGNKSPVRSIKLLKRVMIFIKSRGSIKMAISAKEQG